MDNQSGTSGPRSHRVGALLFGWPSVIAWPTAGLMVDQLWHGHYSLLSWLLPFLFAGWVVIVIAGIGSVVIRRPMPLLICAGAMSTAGVVALVGGASIGIAATFGGPFTLKSSIIAAVALASAAALFRRVRIVLAKVHKRIPNQAGLATALVALGALLAFGIPVLIQMYVQPATPLSGDANLALAPAKAGARCRAATPSATASAVDPRRAPSSCLCGRQKVAVGCGWMAKRRRMRRYNGGNVGRGIDRR